MKKVLLLFMVAAAFVSCSNGNAVRKMASLYEDAIDDVMSADDIVELEEIDRQLELDCYNMYVENKQELDRINEDIEDYRKDPDKTFDELDDVDRLAVLMAKYERVKDFKEEELEDKVEYANIRTFKEFTRALDEFMDSRY